MTSDAPQVKDGSPRCGATTHAQDLPPGYKRTEVGVIPEDWHAGKLGEAISDLLAGVSVNSTTGEVDHGVPAILKTSCVESGTFLPHEAKPIAPKDRRRAKLNPRRDTILISRMNTIELVGECGFVDRDHPDLFIPDRLWMTQIRSSSSVSARWLAAVLSSAPYRRQLQSIATGTSGSMKNIAKHSLLGLQVAYPRHDEQRAIAEALSDVDGLLGALEALIAKKRAIKQAAMQQLLTGKTRLPGFSGEWETKRLGELGYFLKGSGVKRDDAQSGHLACVRYGEIYTTHHDYIREFHSRISPEVADKATRLEYGDLLFAGSGETKEEIGKCVALVLEEEAYAGGDIVILRPSGANSLFLGYALNMPDVARQKASFGQGDAVVHISAAALAQVNVAVPSRAEQSAIATVLANMDAEIAALEARRDKTRQIKQGMMQQLLTGRIRLIKPIVGASDNATDQAGRRKANVHFVRSVLAAEIIDRLHEHPTFGHVKFEKMMFLVEHLCEIETGSTYLRKAAGPYDNRALRSIDSQLRKQQWFDARKEGKRYLYLPMQKRGGHKKYFDRYFPGIGETFDAILKAFETLDTERCEIVATLLAAWSDLSDDRNDVSDQLIVHEVLNNWHESKRRIPEERWLAALVWMRENDFVPKGVG